MKNIIRSIACLIVILCLYSCEKDIESDSYNIETNSIALNAQDGADCTQDVNEELVKRGVRSYLYHIINSEIEDHNILDYGTPILSATHTVMNSDKANNGDKSNNSTKIAISFTPLVDLKTETTKSILLTQITKDGGFYKIITKESIEKAQDFSLTLDGNSSGEFFTKTEILEIFDQFTCLVFCLEDGINTRGIDCPTFGTSWWKKLFRTIGGWFSGGGSDTYNGPPINPWNDFEGGDFSIPSFLTGGGIFSGGGTALDPSIDIHDEVLLLNSCVGFDDPTNIDSGLGEHPEYEFCDQWMNYWENCLSDSYSTQTESESIIYEWASFLNSDYAAFDDVTSMTLFCTETDKIDCYIALSEFEDLYGLELSEYEKNQILKNIDCDNEFDKKVWDSLFKSAFSKSKGGQPIDLVQTFADCFGTPNANGDYIDCNNAGNSTFELTLYSDQPIPNSRDPFSGIPGVNLDVGHSFINLSTNYGGSNSSITYGFYPEQSVNLNNPSAPMEIIDDGGHEFSSSVTIELSCAEFNKAITNSISLTSQNYDIENYNCTDYAIGIANSVSLGVADTAPAINFMGNTYGAVSNPGDLGEDIKLLTSGTINSTGGTAHETECN